MSVRYFTIAAVALLTLSGCETSTETQAPRTIEVNGAGLHRATPDIMTMRLTISQTGLDIAKLKGSVDALTQNAQTLFAEYGVENRYIQSYALQVGPVYDYQNGSRKLLHYQVARNIKLTLVQPDGFDQLLDSLIAIGIADIGQVQFELGNPDAAYQQALQHAVENAKTKASALAQQLNLKLGDVVTLTEQSAAPTQIIGASAEMRMASDSNVTRPGEETIRARVVMTYQVQD